MRVLLLTDNKQSGGAAIAAGRLARALTAAGHEVAWAAGILAERGPSMFQFTDGPLPWYAAERLASKMTPGLAQAIVHANRLRRIEQIVELVQPDIINVHNIHGAGLPADLPYRLARRRPVVWTLHDMWAFTGGCAYSFDCRRFESHCTRECPHAGRVPAIAASRVPAEFDRRERALKLPGRIIFATPSRWLAEQAGRGLLRDQTVRIIPYSVDLDTFRPMDQAAARSALGLPSDRPILLTVGVDAGDARKGQLPFIDALGRLTDRPVTWVSVGGTEAGLPEHVRQIILAPMRDERLLRLAYCAADLHVLPTLADNLPNVLLEAAACATPSIAFAVGGVPEAVIEEITGSLAQPGDAADLARVIDQALALPADRVAALRDSCRDFACTHFAPQLQASRYAAVFEQLLRHQEQIAA